MSRELINTALQLIYVKCGDTNSIYAEVSCYERDDISENWRQVMGPFPAVIGKEGWVSSEFKTEGDHKTPVGVFTLGEAFGYGENATEHEINYPYLPIHDDLKCIDDPDSIYYNKIVDANEVTKDWNSAEDMLRKDDLYKWGIVINHHREEDCDKCGSCIFMHIWRDKDAGTEGCIAMAEENLLKILKWLKVDKKPCVIAVPEELREDMLTAYP